MHSLHAMFLQEAVAPPPAAGRGVLAYTLAAALGVVVLYLSIRLLIWDRVNQETPNQEEPVFHKREEPSPDER